jgi:hypothetical protein
MFSLLKTSQAKGVIQLLDASARLDAMYHHPSLSCWLEAARECQMVLGVQPSFLFPEWLLPHLMGHSSLL